MRETNQFKIQNDARGHSLAALTKFKIKELLTCHFLMPPAPLPLPNAPCPMPNAQCSISNVVKNWIRP
ncbi:hypothetical protein VF14_34995 [Nostoc linckia z18]|uniref:Uncharacterized protein n=2 Tax=Nostoc linckia TaxID=92942 RepID=A0A9Q5Z4N7_NOSLI|nr:hypothetical protein [Nostoc linckia]PHK29220.1 hypothetical protein VF12_31445 [Nostoc linckia z15]PHJ71429.1 hypothetical protein VF06_37270 [Nostoc linckia z4]PHJ85398.1 hypothetical protein VF04_35795 [Nostoc linckia z7]PHJ93091.1 hypothetical protein VF08_35935 [Nostoc linckia z8]PHK12398.1 hypothetical protein VF11_34845 [Nostoc linckia z14]